MPSLLYRMDIALWRTAFEARSLESTRSSRCDTVSASVTVCTLAPALDLATPVACSRASPRLRSGGPARRAGLAARLFLGGGSPRVQRTGVGHGCLCALLETEAGGG